MKEFIEHVCKEIGPRITGSEEERKVEEMIKGILKKYVDEIEEDEFYVDPRALQHLIDTLVYTFIIAFIIYFIYPIISLILGIILFSIFYLSRFKDIHLLDKIYANKTSRNIIGKLHPKNKARKIVILSGHHDSAYQMPLLGKKYVRYASMLQNLGVYGLISLTILSFIHILIYLNPSVGNIYYIYSIGYAVDFIFILDSIIGLASAIFFRRKMVSNKPILGAYDNLSAVSIVLEAAKKLSSNRPQNIEIWFVSFGSEEPGIRGSRHFIIKRRDMLRKTDIYVINMDGLGLEKLALISRCISVGSKYSEELNKLISNVASELSIPINIVNMPYGDTDASSFSKRGVRATTLYQTEKNVFPFWAHWHQPTDTPDIIREEKLEEALKVVLQTIKKIDEN